MISENIKAVAYEYVKMGLNITPCKFGDKKSLLEGWNNKTGTTTEDLDSWFNDYGDINLGLPLGSSSSLVMISVDGAKGQKELDRISKGELPPTLEFKTPSGGYRYLYKLPKGIETKIYRKRLGKEHEELAILSEDQQTLLPPSRNSNEESYEWAEGKDPSSIEVVDAPDWLIKLITKKSTLVPFNSNAKGVYQLGNIDAIYKNCSWFKQCIDETGSLSGKERFNCLTVINTCDNSEKNALEFLVNNPNYSKEKILKTLDEIKDKGYSPVSCSKIRSNFGGHCEGCTLGVGSPATLGRKKTEEELKAVGFIFEDGRIVGLNANKFAAYLNSRLEILYTDAGIFYMYSNNYWKYVDENYLSRICRDILHEFKPNFWTELRESNYMAALEREAIRISKLDSDRTKINLINGFFDLNTYEIMPHTPLIRSSHQLPINHDTYAKCPTFGTFLEDILGGDKELINLVQEMFGYCLTAETSAQKAFILYGRGSNGKSLLAEVLMNLVGKSNTSAVPLNELDNPFARYELVDKLLNLATENELSERGLNTTFFKSIVSGDAIQVEKKFEQSFMYQPICKLVFCLNNLPYSKDKSWGFQRRLIVIPFNRVFREDDPATQNYGELRDALLSELDGIFIWALEGLKRLKENKFKFSKSEAVNEALEDYKTEVNPYYNFVKEKLEQGDEEESITNETLSDTFKAWATKNGHKNLATASNQKIVREVRNVLLDIKIDIKYGDKVKVCGKRCTKKVRFKKGKSVHAERVA